MTGAPLIDAEWFQGFPKTPITVGSVAMFTYRNGKSHVGLVESLDSDCFWMSDYNYRGDGKYGRRCVPYDNYALKGFWSPPNQRSMYLAGFQFPAVASTNIDQRVFASNAGF
jgi:hypothetical protein